MIAAAAAAGDREAVLHGRNWRVVDLLELGRISEAAAEIDAYEALADAVALPHFRWYVPLWRATLALLAGRWAEARELSERALAIGRHADDPNAWLFVGIQRQHSLYARGRMAESDRARLVEGGATSPAAADWLVNVALLDAETGATENARRLVSELSQEGALAMDVNWHSACVLAEAAVSVRDRAAGAALYRLLEPHARLFPIIARAVGSLGSAELYVGRLAALLGRHDEAVTRLRRAMAENERVGAEPYAALTLLRLGETLIQIGEQESARDVLRQAARRADRLDMPALAADAERRLGATVTR
jgi:tetratricopeptide (TPR) repeat protein